MSDSTLLPSLCHMPSHSLNNAALSLSFHRSTPPIPVDLSPKSLLHQLETDDTGRGVDASGPTVPLKRREAVIFYTDSYTLKNDKRGLMRTFPRSGGQPWKPTSVHCIFHKNRALNTASPKTRRTSSLCIYGLSGQGGNERVVIRLDLMQ